MPMEPEELFVVVDVPDGPAFAEADQRAMLQKGIRRRLKDFDAFALLRLLDHMGYTAEEIRFRSFKTRCFTRSLLEDIEFLEEPSRMVLITVNYGFMTVHSPMPSYFHKVSEEEIDEDAFEGFLQYFDDLVIRSFLNSIYPEYDRRLHGNGWPRVVRRFQRLLGIPSESTLHWLFQLAYPELEVALWREQHRRGLLASDVRLGRTRLGDASVFGGRASAGVSGFNVTLLAEDEMCDNNVPWGAEARGRLETLLLPLLAESGISLKVVLIIRRKRGWARLGPGSMLGYDPIKGGEIRARRVVIFRGMAPRSVAHRTNGIQKEDQRGNSG